MTTKTQKSKSTYVSIVLAILLVLSVLISFSGAWFTDKATNSSNTQIQFGTVALGSETIEVNLPNPLLPGHQISFGEIEYVGDVNAYFRVYFDVSNYVETDPTLAELKTMLNANTVQYGIFDVEDADSLTLTPDSIDILTATGNNYQALTCNFVVTIEVIQQANIPGIANPSAPTTAEYEKIFSDYYTDSGTNS